MERNLRAKIKHERRLAAGERAADHMRHTVQALGVNPPAGGAPPNLAGPALLSGIAAGAVPIPVAPLGIAAGAVPIPGASDRQRTAGSWAAGYDEEGDLSGAGGRARAESGGWSGGPSGGEDGESRRSEIEIEAEIPARVIREFNER